MAFNFQPPPGPKWKDSLHKAVEEELRPTPSPQTMFLGNVTTPSPSAPPFQMPEPVLPPPVERKIAGARRSRKKKGKTATLPEELAPGTTSSTFDKMAENAAQEKIKSLQTNLNKAETSLHKTEEKLKELHRKYHDLSLLSKSAQDTVKSSNTTIDDLKSANENAEQKLDEEKKAHCKDREKIRHLETDLKQREALIKENQDTIAGLKRQLDQKDKDEQQNNNNVAKLTSDADALKTKYDEIYQTLQDDIALRNQLQKDKDDAQEQFALIKDAKDTEIQNLKDEVTSIQQTLADFRLDHAQRAKDELQYPLDPDNLRRRTNRARTKGQSMADIFGGAGSEGDKDKKETSSEDTTDHSSNASRATSSPPSPGAGNDDNSQAEPEQTTSSPTSSTNTVRDNDTVRPEHSPPVPSPKLSVDAAEDDSTVVPSPPASPQRDSPSSPVNPVTPGQTDDNVPPQQSDTSPGQTDDDTVPPQQSTTPPEQSGDSIPPQQSTTPPEQSGDSIPPQQSTIPPTQSDDNVLPEQAATPPANAEASGNSPQANQPDSQPTGGSPGGDGGDGSDNGAGGGGGNPPDDNVPAQENRPVVICAATTLHNPFKCWILVDKLFCLLLLSWFWEALGYTEEQASVRYRAALGASNHTHTPATKADDSNPPASSEQVTPPPPAGSDNTSTTPRNKQDPKTPAPNTTDQQQKIQDAEPNKQAVTRTQDVTQPPPIQVIFAFLVHLIVYNAILYGISAWRERNIWLAANGATRSHFLQYHSPIANSPMASPLANAFFGPAGIVPEFARFVGYAVHPKMQFEEYLFGVVGRKVPG